MIKTATAFTLIAAAGFCLSEPVHGQVFFPPSLSKGTVSCSWSRTGKMPIMDDRENKWFSSYLSAAKEPSLFSSTQQGRLIKNLIRFTWLPTSDHPVIIRIEGLLSGSSRLFAKQLSGASGYNPGKIEKQVERELTQGEVRDLRKLLSRTRLTSLPARICDGGLDGSK